MITEPCILNACLSLAASVKWTSIRLVSTVLAFHAFLFLFYLLAVRQQKLFKVWEREHTILEVVKLGLAVALFVGYAFIYLYLWWGSH